VTSWDFDGTLAARAGRVGWRECFVEVLDEVWMVGDNPTAGVPRHAGDLSEVELIVGAPGEATP
jgi:hypothetical protein